MVLRVRLLFVSVLLLLSAKAHGADARFDLVGPRIDVRVTRGTTTLPIAAVPNLQPGDKLWLHPNLPGSQSVHYLLVCIFLRGNTNPPPPDWFIRIPTWDRKIQQEGTFVTVPEEAQQVVLLMAPETGGDFSTIRSAVMGRPGVFVRASQDLIIAGFEQARIEKYLASIRRVPASEATELQKHSDLLARTLNLKPNPNCFTQPVDTQFTCLTQTGTQMLLDDGHGQSMIATLSTGPGSDFIAAASSTSLAGGGLYSAYVGAVVDLVRLMSNLHTAKYQYIPAIGSPQGDSLNLRLNTPPSFQNPKSVLVIGLPAVQKAVAPPLRSADATYVACMLRPLVVLPIEGAPLVFSTGFAHDLALHFNTTPGEPVEKDIPLVPDAFQGGLVLQRGAEQHTLLRDPLTNPAPTPKPEADTPVVEGKQKSIVVSATIQGHWGFDFFEGPTVSLQQRPGSGWHIVAPAGVVASSEIIAGQSANVLIGSTGTACVHTITARMAGVAPDLLLPFKASPRGSEPNDLEVALPPQHEVMPGDLQLRILQYGEPKADELTTRTFSEPAHITGAEIHAGDRTMAVSGTNLGQIASITLGDLVFAAPANADQVEVSQTPSTLRLSLPVDAAAPSTHADEHLVARVTLRDGRKLRLPVSISSARPSIKLLRKTVDPTAGSNIVLSNADDLPLAQKITFTLKTQSPFPRNGQIEVETLDGTLRTVLTLAPSGGLVLQDPRTIVATLDPLRSFGPSAFGPIHLRAVYPGTSGAERPLSPSAELSLPTSDWIPLATLIRLPVLTALQCPSELGKPCVLTGSNLFLIQSLSTDPAFAHPTVLPDGYIGSTITVDGTSTGVVYLKLRDDPAETNMASVPMSRRDSEARR